MNILVKLRRLRNKIHGFWRFTIYSRLRNFYWHTIRIKSGFHHRSFWWKFDILRLKLGFSTLTVDEKISQRRLSFDFVLDSMQEQLMTWYNETFETHMIKEAESFIAIRTEKEAKVWIIKHSQSLLPIGLSYDD